MELTRIWEVVQRRKWVIIQAVIVVTLVAVIGSHLIAPSYQCKSKVVIKQAKKGAVDIGAMGLPGLTSMIVRTSADVSINRVLATSRPYMDEMIRALQIRDSQGRLLTADELTGGGLALAVKGIISPRPTMAIAQFEATEILELRASSGNPKEAMMMANSLADMMVEENRGQTRAEYSSARVFLQSQLKKVKDRYLAALGSMTEFQKREKTIDLKLETKLATERMSELLKQKEEDTIVLAQTLGRLEALRSQLAKQSPDFLFADTLKDSPQIATLVKMLTDLQLQLTQASSELTERHPRILALKEQIHLAEKMLSSELKAYEVSAPQVISLERQIAAVGAHRERISTRLKEYEETLGGIPEKVSRQESMGMELNVTQQVYRALLDSLYEIGIGEANTLSEIRIVEQAVIPSSPASPNKTVNGVLGIFLGLIFGLGLAFLMEYLDDRIRRVEDLKAFAPITLLGAVPEFDEETVPLISRRDPNDPICESYRKIRNYLTKNEKVINSLLITSAGPCEGKSTTVVNLAISVAREGKKVVILDMDLRRASLHRYFELPNDVGMSDVLQARIPLDEVIQTTQIEGLRLLSSGPPFPDPGGLMESDQMGRLMSDLKSRFDLVILDSAPLLVKSDALVLARHVDGSVIVLESEKTTRRAVHEVMELMAKARIRPLGFVLNRFSIRKGRYHYQEYYYANYGRELSTGESSV
jgi:capsular exopolysaccharide synthesis family protein